MLLLLSPRITVVTDPMQGRVVLNRDLPRRDNTFLAMTRRRKTHMQQGISSKRQGDIDFGTSKQKAKVGFHN